jgi:hypothetical protein
LGVGASHPSRTRTVAVWTSCGVDFEDGEAERALRGVLLGGEGEASPASQRGRGRGLLCDYSLVCRGAVASIGLSTCWLAFAGLRCADFALPGWPSLADVVRSVRVGIGCHVRRFCLRRGRPAFLVPILRRLLAADCVSPLWRERPAVPGRHWPSALLRVNGTYCCCSTLGTRGRSGS